MKDSNIVLASDVVDYCKDISVDIANKSNIKHINISNINTVAEIDDFSGRDTKAVGEKILLFVLKTDLNTANFIYNNIKQNSEMEIGKVIVNFYIQNEDTKEYENSVLEFDNYCCFRSVDKLYIDSNTVSMSIKLSATPYQ